MSYAGHRVHGEARSTLTGVRSHNPFSPSRGQWRVPALDPDARPVDGPLRIAALVDRYPPTVNAGGETYLHTYLRDSVARGHRADVVTAAPAAYVHDGVHVWPRTEMARLRHHDVLIGHLMWTREAVEFAAEHRVPLVYIVHNDRQLGHWKLRPDNMTVTVFNTRWIADRLRPRWAGPSEVLPPPTLRDVYAVDGDPSARPYVTLINANPDKGSDLLYAVARRPPARRYLAVEGGYGDQRRPGADTPSVTWQPATPNIRDVVYARTRVLLVPSKYESWGLAAVEAMCAGIPVIAHPTHGLEEALGDAAIWCNRDYPGQWIDALGDLDDPDLYAAWSARALDRALELDGHARLWLNRWDTTLRLAATARRVLSLPTPAATTGVTGP